MSQPRSTLFAAALALGAACTSTPVEPDSGLQGLALTDVKPGLVLPGSVLVLEGRSFVSSTWGTTRLRLDGLFDDGSGEREVEVTAEARFVDFGRMEVDVDQALLDAFGSQDGLFTGQASLEVDSTVDGETHASESVFIELDVRRALSPGLESVATGQLIFVNDPIQVEGNGLLLGEGEGTTYAVVEGCFTPVGASDCTEVGPTEVPVEPAGEFERTAGSFAFAPTIAGIEPGTFQGTVFLRNDHAGGDSRESLTKDVSYDLTEPAVLSVDPPAASLGQYVNVVGGGFLGGEEGGLTLLELSGTFTPEGSDESMPVQDVFLIPEFIGGREVRYVLNEDDALGELLDLRRVTGTFVGQLTPVTEYEGVEVEGSSATFELGIAPVKQVVYLDFKPSYVESLRHFGLRALDQRIRDRIVEVMERDYAGVNLEVRQEEPEDFALYSVVEIAGPDPNGLGLLGYDNTPGKDTNNERLFDRIGGVNAQTQEDGYPGYGGVFIESLFAFSKHPGSYADKIPAADQAFDDVFDPFRPDRGGQPVTSADLSGGIPERSSGEGCPASARGEQISCAVWVLGSLIGTTLSHEVGHSLGLANPFGEGFHNSSDEPNRLMDSGGNRPFTERAELFGEGPARFCTTEYDYLREILPSDEPPDPSPRPSCF